MTYCPYPIIEAHGDGSMFYRPPGLTTERPPVAGAGLNAGRVWEWCGVAIAGYASRRTCSPRCRQKLRRAGGVGQFTPRDVTPSPRTTDHPRTPNPSHLCPGATGRCEARNRGVRDFREVRAGVGS